MDTPVTARCFSSTATPTIDSHSRSKSPYPAARSALTVPILGVGQYRLPCDADTRAPTPRPYFFVALGCLMRSHPNFLCRPTKALLAQRSVPRAASPASTIRETLRLSIATLLTQCCFYLPEAAQCRSSCKDAQALPPVSVRHTTLRRTSFALTHATQPCYVLAHAPQIIVVMLFA